MQYVYIYIYILQTHTITLLGDSCFFWTEEAATSCCGWGSSNYPASWSSSSLSITRATCITVGHTTSDPLGQNEKIPCVNKLGRDDVTAAVSSDLLSLLPHVSPLILKIHKPAGGPPASPLSTRRRSKNTPPLTRSSISSYSFCLLPSIHPIYPTIPSSAVLGAAAGFFFYFFLSMTHNSRVWAAHTHTLTHTHTEAGASVCTASGTAQ